MRTKWCKELCEYIFSGKTCGVKGYPNSMKMVSGEVLTPDGYFNQSNNAFVLNDSRNYKFPLTLYTGSQSNRLFRYLVPMGDRNTTSSYGVNNINSSYEYMLNHSSSPNQSGTPWFFGSGTSAPTEEDYKLESGLEGVFMSSYTYDDANGMIQLKIENSTENSIEINELGIFNCPFAGNYTLMPSYQSKYSVTNFIMLERRVLEAPITIEAGGTGYLYIKA